MSTSEKFAAYPRQGHFEEKKLLILQEAASLFVRKGVHETSLNDIASHFKISKPALYHYVSSKDQIIAEILTYAQRTNQQKMEEILSSDRNGREKLRQSLKNYGYGMNDDFGRCLATVQASTFTEETQVIYRTTHRRILKLLGDLIREGIDDGSLKPCDPKIMIFSIIGSMNNMARWFNPDGFMSIQDVTDQIVNAFLDGISA